MENKDPAVLFVRGEATGRDVQQATQQRPKKKPAGIAPRRGRGRPKGSFGPKKMEEIRKCAMQYIQREAAEERKCRKQSGNARKHKQNQVGNTKRYKKIK
ncbi:hypothetical protein FOCC_FOCC008241, partial [Frankliniella occidentalis]